VSTLNKNNTTDKLP